MIVFADKYWVFEMHFWDIFCIKLSVFVGTFRKISPLAQEEMEQDHILLTPFNLFEWKEEMLIQLRYKGLYRVTMGTEVEPNFAMEKSKYFNKLNQAFGLLCLIISRELLFHVDNLTTPNEVWVKLESLFGKIDELRGRQLGNELISLSPSFRS